jgi:REP-associated tyrosine transposase
MVVGHHLVWTVYGWWLPNDPRGSTSHEIRVEPIADLGPLHYGRKRVQPPSREIRLFHETARDVLRHEVLTFTDDDIALVGQMLGEVIRKRRYTCYACAVLPEHVHLLMRRHRDKAEMMIEEFQQASRQRLIDAGRRAVTHPVWGGPGWKVFLNTRRDMERIEKYVRENPLKSGLPEQHWDFVRVYDGWMPAYHGAASAKRRAR